MRWTLLLILAVALTACGGDDDETGDNSDSGNASAAPTTAAEVPSDDGDADDGDSESGPSSIAFTGASTGEITDRGSCSGGPGGDGFQLFTSLYDEAEDLTWMFQISIPEFDGPGQYEVGDSLIAGEAVSFDDTSITFGNNAGDEWGSTRVQGGEVSVDADESSGTVDATLVSEDDSTEMHVSGAWTCSD